MSRNIARPLTKLTNAVRMLAQGDLNTRVAPDSDGVIRELENGVNAMAATLQAAHGDLERRVADATQQLEQKKEEAERANSAKSRFLAAASHDLRQPMHALGLFVASLHGKPMSDEAARVVPQIERSVTALQDLLDALLDISRLDAGVITPRLADLPIDRLLSALAINLAPSAEERDIALRWVPSRVIVRSDPMLLERILLNLVSNAVRYTARGKVLLGCRRRGDKLRIEVWDTGIGIAQDQQRAIFEEFYQVPYSEIVGEKGIGLGLAIVDRLARLLGHDLEVRSRPGIGSMFSISLPIVRDNKTERNEAVAYPGECIDLAGTSVMVIDDDPLALRATTMLLESWGCMVIIAASGVEAEALLIVATERPPQLVICDFRLSHGETGIDVLSRLHARFPQPVPAIVISADTSAEVMRAVESGGYPFLHKPLRPAMLRELMQQLLSARGEPPA